jgi:hypothetical protein
VEKLRDILKQNLNSLHSVEFRDMDAESNFGCFELLAPTISKLAAICYVEDVAFRPIVFSNLRNVSINAYGEQIAQFFSVTHPLLEQVDLGDLGVWTNTGNVTLAQQPAIRYVTLNTKNNLANALLKAMNHKAVTHMKLYDSTECLDPDVIDLSSFSDLKQFHLIMDLILCPSIEDVLKQNKISSLKIINNLKLQPVLPYLSNLWHLSFPSLNEYTFSEILMKLPKLNSLEVHIMRMPFGSFTRLVNETPNSIKRIVIDSFSERNYQRIQIIHSLESIKIDYLGWISNMISGKVRWILFVISTLHVDEVHGRLINTTIHNLLSECFTTPWIRDNSFVTTIEYLVQQLKNTLEEVIETEKYLKVSYEEKKMILNSFNTMFNEKQLKEGCSKYPAMDLLMHRTREKRLNIINYWKESRR